MNTPRSALVGSTTLVAAGALAALLAACASAPPRAPDALSSTVHGCPAASSSTASSTRSTVIGPATAPAHVSDPQTALREICAMMQRSAARWTAGDLDAFMGDYMPGAGTTYIGRKGVVRGPEAIRAGYAPRFAAGGVHDSLSFEDVEVDLLAPDLANTIAWYVLSRGDSTIARGPTSLVMRRVDGRWRIIHDHSS
ncbi:MAG TPA: SgcJ/EcaC family oxidoreductase [Gemmatimonadaceae bacterium]|nr:SgcJ/EcaC family oxidoreductase [Gemmatimonadaceae bacterium]